MTLASILSCCRAGQIKLCYPKTTDTLHSYITYMEALKKERKKDRNTPNNFSVKPYNERKGNVIQVLQ